MPCFAKFVSNNLPIDIIILNINRQVLEMLKKYLIIYFNLLIFFVKYMKVYD